MGSGSPTSQLRLTPADEAAIARVFDAHANQDAARLIGEIRASSSESGFVVRHQAVWALGRLRAVGSVPLLGELLAGDPSPEVRSTSARALGRIRKELATPALVAALDDESELVRGHVAAVLGEVGDPVAVGPLVQRLRDESPNVRDSAAISLGKLGDPAALVSLVGLRQTLGWRESKHVRRAIRRLRG